MINSIVGDFASTLGTTPEQLLKIGTEYKIAQAYGNLYIGILFLIISIGLMFVTWKMKNSEYVLVPASVFCLLMVPSTINLYLAITGLLSPQGQLIYDIISRFVRLQ